MKDRIVIDGVAYVREDLAKIPASANDRIKLDDEIVLDDWQRGKVEGAWAEVEKQEKAAREAATKHKLDNPLRAIYGMIDCHYSGDRPDEKYDDGTEITFEAQARKYCDWLRRNGYSETEWVVNAIIDGHPRDAMVPQGRRRKVQSFVKITKCTRCGAVLHAGEYGCAWGLCPKCANESR